MVPPPPPMQQKQQQKTAQQQLLKKSTPKVNYTDEFKDRLRSSIKSISDNFSEILSAARVSDDGGQLAKNSVTKMAEYFALRDEVFSRSVLITKAINELLALTNDIRQSLILRDFNFIGESLADQEKKNTAELAQVEANMTMIRASAAALTMEVERHLADNFFFRH